MDMANIITLEMDDGSEIYIQAAKAMVPGEEVDAAAGKLKVKASDFLEKTIPQVNALAKQIKDKVVESAVPDEIELEFSFGFTTDTKILISSASVSSGITLKLKWSADKAEK